MCAPVKVEKRLTFKRKHISIKRNAICRAGRSVAGVSGLQQKLQPASAFALFGRAPSAEQRSRMFNL